jgi:hypothetical protein
LKEKEAAKGGGATGADTAVPLVPSPTLPPVTGGQVASAMLTAFAIFIGGNLILAMLLGFNSDIFGRGWPIEFLLMAAGLAHIMRQTRVIWLLIPTGILLGNGFLFMYYNLTGNWHQWAFLWPLELFLIGGVIWYTVRRYAEGNVLLTSTRLGGRLRRISLVTAVIFTFMAIFVD